jgi:sodium transport system permease protein
MNAFRVVLDKEVRENLRDRRSLLNALLWGPLFMPLMFFGQLYFIAKQSREIWDRPPSIAVAGAEHAPTLMRFLQQRGAEIRPAPADPAAAIRELTEDVVLVIPAAYPEQWQRGESAAVELWYDASRHRSNTRQRRVALLLGEYARTMGSLRLRARGLDPGVAAPVKVEEHDVAEGGRGTAMLAAFLPFVLMFSAFMGGFYLAVDTTAGERERQSLEALLINPVPRWQIVLGKLAATVLFALAATVIGILAFAVVLELGERLALADVPGLELHVSGARWLLLGALLVPVVLLASALETLVATFSRTFREAQTYVQFLMLVPMIPFLIITFNPVRPQALDMLVPFWSQSVLIDRLFRGEALDPGYLALSGGASVLAAAVLVALVVRMYRVEKLLFSGP